MMTNSVPIFHIACEYICLPQFQLCPPQRRPGRCGVGGALGQSHILVVHLRVGQGQCATEEDPLCVRVHMHVHIPHKGHLNPSPAWPAAGSLWMY